MGPSCTEKKNSFHGSDLGSGRSRADTGVQRNGPGVQMTRHCSPAPKVGLGLYPGRAEASRLMPVCEVGEAGT